MTEPSTVEDHCQRVAAGEPPYEVGYGRPPRATQFKRGQSGNPKGRPKGSRNVSSELVDFFFGKVTVNDGGRSRRVTRLNAVLLTQWHRAVKGDERAARALVAFAQSRGLFDEPMEIEPSQEWTDDMLKQLTDEELEQILKLDEKRQAMLAERAKGGQCRIQ
jgi:hypothetical protein